MGEERCGGLLRCNDMGDECGWGPDDVLMVEGNGDGARERDGGREERLVPLLL